MKLTNQDRMAQPVSGAVDERAVFVKWANNEAFNFKRAPDGGYYWDDLDSAWRAWQDRAALSRAQQAPAVSDAQWMALPAGPIKSLYQARDALTGPAADGFSRRAAIAAIDAALSQPAAAPVSAQTKERP